MFEGFSTPNYVQVPHEFFDIIMETDVEKSAKDRGITKGEIKLLAFMIRYTFGWQKSGFSLKFSYSDIQEHLNMQRQQVNDAIKRCLEKEYIERKEIDGEFFYRLKLKDNDVPWELPFDWKQKAPKKESQDDQYDNHTSVENRYDNHTSNQYDNHTDFGVKIIPDEIAATSENTGFFTPLKKMKESMKENNKEREREDKPVGLPTQSPSDEFEQLEFEYRLLQELTNRVFGLPRAYDVDVESIWNHWKNRFPQYDLGHIYAVMRATQNTARVKDDLTGIIVKRLPSAMAALVPLKQRAYEYIAELKAELKGKSEK